MSMGLLVTVVDTIIVNVAIPTLQRELDATSSGLQWIIDSYILVLAGMLLTMGSLADRFGRKRGILMGLVVLGVSSVLAAYSTNTPQLIASRTVMGLGAAMIMPSTLSIIADVFPREERAKAIGIWAGIAAISVPLGLVVGGALLDHFWWGSVFLFSVPIIILAIIAGVFLIPESRHETPPRIDPIGAVLSISALSLLIFALIDASSRGWLDPLIIGEFVAAVALGAIFVGYELRSTHPMLDIRLFKNPRLASGAGASALGSVAFIGFLFMLTQYFQFVRDSSPLETGLGIIPLVLGFFSGTIVAPRLVVRYGTKVVAAGALIVVAVAMTLYGLEIPAKRFHFFQYAPATLLVFDALRFTLKDRWLYTGTLALVALIGLGDETIQWILPTRHFGFLDILVNAEAGLLTLLFIRFVLREENYPWGSRNRDSNTVPGT